jgi:hypothetical protein
MKKVPLSPGQAAAFAMGRTLLVFESWVRHTEAAIELERAMLIDFAVQYPRSIASLLPTVPPIIKAHGIDQADLGDLFAVRRLATLREDFSTVLVMLTSRHLVDEQVRASSAAFTITSEGRHAASAFSSPLALAIRALADALCLAWRRSSVETLRSQIRDALPDSSRDASELGRAVALREDE